MSDFLIVLASVGLTLILKDGFIFKIPRDWLKSQSEILSKLLSCSQCLGFWCGFIIGCILTLLQGVSLLGCFAAFLYGWASSVSSYLIDLIIDRLDISIFNQTKKTKGKQLLHD